MNYLFLNIYWVIDTFNLNAHIVIEYFQKHFLYFKYEQYCAIKTMEKFKSTV